MNDKKFIIAGLIIFFAAALLPFWLNFGKAAPAPEPVLTDKAKAAKYCVLPKDEMKGDHMQILDVWRDAVVRNAERVYTSSSGRVYNMSLSTGDESCLGCHSNKAEFCDRCHNYASVDPYCWDCHIDPKEKK